jgi:hypothetical protein
VGPQKEDKGSLVVGVQLGCHHHHFKSNLYVIVVVVVPFFFLLLVGNYYPIVHIMARVISDLVVFTPACTHTHTQGESSHLYGGVEKNCIVMT